MTLISKRKVKHVGPLGSPILLVAEAPGEDEDFKGEPLVGASGNVINDILILNDLNRKDIRIANRCNYRPNDNEWKYLNDSSQLKESEHELTEYLTKYKEETKVIITLGDKALSFFGGKYGISNMRGQPLSTENGFVLPTLHPAYTFYDDTAFSLITADIAKAKKYLTNPWRQPEHRFRIDLPTQELVELVNSFKDRDDIILQCDIESIKNTTHIRSIQFGWSGMDAVFIPNKTREGISTEFAFVVQLVLSGKVRKCFQGGSEFDIPMLLLNGFIVENYTDDTQIAEHVLNPAMPKDLASLNAAYAEEPFWKEDGKQHTEKELRREDFPIYGCKDVIVPFQVLTQQLKEMTKEQEIHYRFKMECALMAIDISMQGLPVHQERLRLLKDVHLEKVKTESTILNHLCEEVVNVNSNPQMKKLLYEKFSLPPRRQRKGPRKGAITCDEDAIISLIPIVKQKIDESVKKETKEKHAKILYALKTILNIRGYRKLFSSYFEATISGDGRMRSIYKVAKPWTDRWSCGLFVDGTGINAQTMPRGGIDVEVERVVRQEGI